MRKVIYIGEFALNIIFDATATPADTLRGGRIVNAATITARHGIPSILVGEVSADQPGDNLVALPADAGVDISCVDRYTEGLSPIQLVYPDRKGTGHDVIRYEQYPAERFDVKWPRFDPNDIVVFGGFLPVDPSARERVLQLVTSARDRGCLIVYLPGFRASRAPRITRHMPAILDNLELAHLVLTRTSDLDTIFGNTDDARVFRNNISFYTPRMINTDPAAHCLRAFGNSIFEQCAVTSPHSASMLWNAAATAAIVEYIYHNIATAADLEKIDATTMANMIGEAAAAADKYTAAIDSPLQLAV